MAQEGEEISRLSRFPYVTDGKATARQNKLEFLSHTLHTHTHTLSSPVEPVIERNEDGLVTKNNTGSSGERKKDIFSM